MPQYGWYASHHNMGGVKPAQPLITVTSPGDRAMWKNRKLLKMHRTLAEERAVEIWIAKGVITDGVNAFDKTAMEEMTVFLEETKFMEKNDAEFRKAQQRHGLIEIGVDPNERKRW
jgi:hypothetical protein